MSSASRLAFWSVATQTVRGNFELVRSVAECEKAQNAQKQTDSLGRHGLDGAHIDGLGVIAQPVAKVDTRNHQLVEFLAASSASQCDLEKRICDITVAPCCGCQSEADSQQKQWASALQFWPSTLEIPAMLPAPKAWVGLAKRQRRIIPHRRGVILKRDMAVCLLPCRTVVSSCTFVAGLLGTEDVKSQADSITASLGSWGDHLPALVTIGSRAY